MWSYTVGPFDTIIFYGVTASHRSVEVLQQTHCKSIHIVIIHVTPSSDLTKVIEKKWFIVTGHRSVGILCFVVKNLVKACIGLVKCNSFVVVVWQITLSWIQWPWVGLEEWSLFLFWNALISSHIGLLFNQTPFICFLLLTVIFSTI